MDGVSIEVFDERFNSAASRRRIALQYSQGHSSKNQRARDDQSHGHSLGKEYDAAEGGKNRNKELRHRRLGCRQASQRFVPENISQPGRNDAGYQRERYAKRRQVS